MFRLFAFLLTSAFCVQAVAATATTGHQRLDAFLRGMHSLKGTFEQTIFDDSGARVQDSKGTMALERPNRFRFQYTEPYEQLIVADGEKVWVYDPELKQVTVRSIGASLGNTPALLLSSDRPISSAFSLTEEGRKDGLLWVSLKPFDKNATFKHIRLGFLGPKLVVMSMKDNFGQTTQVRFIDLVRNAKLDPKLFQFKPPPGVDVLTESKNPAPSGQKSAPQSTAPVN